MAQAEMRHDVPSPAPPATAAFDVDGTLTRRDTLIPFLAQVCGGAAVARTLARHGVRLGRAMLGLGGKRGDVKQAVLTDLLRGRSATEVREHGERFALRVAERGLRQDTLARWRWHQAQGHQVVMVSASLTDYLEPLGRRLGADAVLASRLEVDAEGRLTGRLVGGNCRGPEKVARLQEWLDGREPVLWAYGDSSGDAELLSTAQHGHRLRRRVRLTADPGHGPAIVVSEHR